jgi:hypothetical protein
VRVEMANLDTVVTWVDARDRLPRSGMPVAAAITGRYPADGVAEPNRVVRPPYGLPSDETVTHWAELPTLPGEMTHAVLGRDVRTALQNAWNARPGT